jgi:hypothetical protein
MADQIKERKMNKDGDFIYDEEDAKDFPPPMTQPKPFKKQHFCYYCGLPAKSIDTMINEWVCDNCA